MASKTRNQMLCQRKETGEHPLCACGCGERVGKKPGSVFAPWGHDGKLRGYIVRGDVARLAAVKWWSLPLCFHGGEFAPEIRRQRAASRRPEATKFVLKKGSEKCQLDKSKSQT